MTEHDTKAIRSAKEHDTKAVTKRETLATRVAEAMAETEAVAKTGENKDQGYKFASAEAILSAARGPLLKRGIILIPSVLDVVEQEIQSRGGAKGSRVIIHIRFSFTDGVETLEQDWRGEGQDYGDKAYGKAYTNAVKTFIRTAWMLPTEHDDPEASDPGQRAANQTPAWQQSITKAKYDEAWAALASTIGEERTAALVAAITETWGYLPNGYAALAKAFVGHLQAELQPHGLEDVIAAAQSQLVEDREQTRAEVEQAREEEAQQVAEQDDAPAPGTIEAPDLPSDPAKAFGTLKAAGCTCPDPIGVRSEKPQLDPRCPISGHGINL